LKRMWLLRLSEASCFEKGGGAHVSVLRRQGDTAHGVVPLGVGVLGVGVLGVGVGVGVEKGKTLALRQNEAR
jgi:hypothetical protein